MAINQYLNDIQQEPIVVSANQTAALNKYYINVASATYTDPTPTEGKGFTVFVRNGTATVGGSAYAVAGTTIYRVYHSGAWANYTHVSTTTANTWDLLQTFTNGVKSTLFTNDDGEFKLTKTIAGSILMWTNGQDFRFSATVGGAPSVELDKTTGKLKLLDETASGVAVLDANKGLTGETKNTAFNKNFGTTSGTVCEGNDSRLSTSIHTAFSAALNPADATTYYSLIIGGLPQVSNASFGIRFLRVGTITDFNILAAHVVNGSGESTSIYLRNATTATDYLITSSWLENYGASTFTNQSYTGLSIPIGNTTDLWNIKIVYPTFATNPTNVQYSWGILIN